MINKAMFTSKTAEWATPQAFFAQLDAEFHFTLDVCATPQNAKCPRFFTKEIDGLAQSWYGETVYCNPPYGRDIAKWVKKASDEVLHAARGGGALLLLCSCPPEQTRHTFTTTYTNGTRYGLFEGDFISTKANVLHRFRQWLSLCVHQLKSNNPRTAR